MCNRILHSHEPHHSVYMEHKKLHLYIHDIFHLYIYQFVRQNINKIIFQKFHNK
jgi:hypothetical protein